MVTREKQEHTEHGRSNNREGEGSQSNDIACLLPS
jgi:hypothetical protein